MSESNQDKSQAKEPTQAKGSQPETIFSYDEVAELVRDFVIAYTEGRVKISFPTVENIKWNAERMGDKIGDTEAGKREHDAKQSFNNAIGIIIGEKASTKEEYRETVQHTFTLIVAAQQGDRISGSFAGASAQERIDTMEKKFNATNHLVEQLVRWIRELSGV